MTTITLTFSSDVNTSVQVGDTAYYCPTTSTAGFSTASNSDIIELGTITSVNISTNTIGVTPLSVTTLIPPVGSFILFSKDNAVNMSSPLGYYSLIQFRNNSLEKGEIFSAACETFGSSK